MHNYSVAYSGSVCAKQFSEPCANDPYAATRRAIVRAAAEIGKAKELAPKPQGWNHISVEPDDL
jgi:hypothetical protein